jgi:membrane protease YdiL (CAAX protease family)
MAIVTMLLAYNCLLVAAFIHHRWKLAKPGAPPLPKRLGNAEVAQFGIRQLALVGLLAYTFERYAWTPESVGFRPGTPLMECILAGEIAFLLVVLVNHAILRLTGKFRSMRLVAVRGNLRIVPRGRVAKWAMAIFVMVFNPFTEEIVMRGILIHQWGLLLDSPAIPIAVGFVLNGALHWYQGWRMQMWHALFFGAAVTLLYSPWGLAAAITAHVFGDVLPLVTLRRQLRAAHKARRLALRTRSS